MYFTLHLQIHTTNLVYPHNTQKGVLRSSGWHSCFMSGIPGFKTRPKKDHYYWVFLYL